MELTGNLKKQVEKAENQEEAKKTIPDIEVICWVRGPRPIWKNVAFYYFMRIIIMKGEKIAQGSNRTDNDR